MLIGYVCLRMCGPRNGKFSEKKCYEIRILIWNFVFILAPSPLHHLPPVFQYIAFEQSQELIPV